MRVVLLLIEHRPRLSRNCYFQLGFLLDDGLYGSNIINFLFADDTSGPELPKNSSRAFTMQSLFQGAIRPNAMA